MILAFTAQIKGFSSPFWLTFKQAKDLKGSVKKGEKGTPITFWGKKTTEKAEGEEEGGEEEEHSFIYCRVYYVFNVEQCENIPADKIPAPEEMKKFDPVLLAEEIMKNYTDCPKIQYEEQAAYYNPRGDFINMPKKETFVSEELYYSTLFHESGHSTGHKDRLNRAGVAQASFFGSHDYSKEELVAEMTASFLCSEAGIFTPRIRAHNAAYLQDWLKALRSDKQMLIIAAQQAQKAADYILQR